MLCHLSVHSHTQGWNFASPTEPTHGAHPIPVTYLHSITAEVCRWDGPPPEYNLTNHCKPATRAHVLPKYPKLKSLVEQGDLVVYLRPLNYTERRDDGYRCVIGLEQLCRLIRVTGTWQVPPMPAQSLRPSVQRTRRDIHYRYISCVTAVSR